MTDGMIFDIQRNSYVDGPGIRTTVFFKGCNLACAWCHNPEGRSTKPQLMHEKNGERLCGKAYTVDGIMQIICKDRRFYETSGGGVTCSGGECMLQIDFLEKLLKACKEAGIHTAVDTAGCVPYAHFERIIPYTDLFLYDVKCYDAALHRQYTGVGNELILGNLKRLLQIATPVWVRIPIIPSVNDSAEEMKRIKDFLDACAPPQRIELLPYHAMGEHKYRALGMISPQFSAPDEETMQSLRAVF